MSVEWHGDGAIDHVRQKAVRMLTRAAIAVTRRAKELLSVPGTGSAGVEGSDPSHRRIRSIDRAEAIKEARAYARAHNAWNADEIKAGKAKRLRATKTGGLTTRRAPKRKKRP